MAELPAELPADAGPSLPGQERLRGLRTPELPNEFEIEVPDEWRGAWTAVNGHIGMTVYPSEGATSKQLPDGQPAHLFKSNRMKAAMTPHAYKEQWLIGELNGVFVHIRHDHLTGKVAVVMADHRLS